MTSTGRILVVDDESNVRDLTKDLLSEEGYDVVAVPSAKEALLLLSHEAFHILLSDIQMPEMDGIGLLKEVRTPYPEMEVLLMTAYGGLPTALEAIRYGAYDYLTKPISRDGLLNTVRRCMEKIDLRRKLKESQTKLVEQEKLAAVGAVSAWLSHRMRNSLSVILMCAHYLQQKIAPSASGDLKEVITAILDKVKTLEHITSDLINYSRRYDLQKSSENINNILEDAVRSLQVQLQVQKITVIKRLDPHLPAIACDPHVLHEAFENILVNVLQALRTQENQSVIVKSELIQGYVRNGSSHAAQDVERYGEPEAVVAVSITNTGSLIPSEIRGRIFTPFFTTKETGSGLGLAIVKNIVESHRGEIFAESSEDKGEKTTTIRMVFPLKS